MISILILVVNVYWRVTKMYEILNAIAWIGSFRWRQNNFTVEAELFQDCHGWYLSEIRKLYWKDEETGLDKEICDLMVDTLGEKDYSSLTDAVITAYLDSKQKGE